ncbi:AAA family ATPase [archaeon]|jgi:DNA repair protein SbcC/Rad50|nr:AAA family ATPase [Candidatus Woesearchaeota archaeon]MBT4136138.1 AAA family ATPase [archaeon]MBT4242269.1 AAA family ATPase [archaeon]MBT4417957.1 AAA family ATPase [archaeon]
MRIKKLSIENIRSYENQEIEFPTGSTLLSGDIGSGKTTILLAIEFALFGLQPSQKASSLLRTNTDTGKVILEFEIEDRNITIERSLKKTNKSITQDSASITIDDEKFEESVTEIKNRVLKLLNYPAEFAKKTNLLYKFTVYTPQEEMKQIILEPGDIRLNTLRHVFGIDKYKKIEENTSVLTSKLREKIRLNEGILYDLEENKQRLKEKQNKLIEQKQKQEELLEEYNKSIKLREEKEKDLLEIQEKINKKSTYENEKSKSNVLMSEKKQQITTLQNNINTLNLQIQEAKKITFNEDEFNSLDDRIDFQQNREEELQKEYIQIIGKINSKDSKKRETEQLKLKISGMDKCPTCLQKVSEEYKSNIFKTTDEEVGFLAKDLEKLIVRKNQLIGEIENTKKIKESYRKRKSELELLKIKSENLKEKEQRILDIEKQKSTIQSDLELLNKHIETIDKSILEFSKYDAIYEKKNKELQLAKQTENQSAIRKAEINKEIQFLDIQIKEEKERIDKKLEIKKKTERIRELEYWISEKFIELVLSTEKQVMLTLKDEFSRLFSKWFAILVSDTLNARLDDDFAPVIEQQDYELDYAFLSGGERTAIALAYRLSLNQVINSMLSNIKTSNLVILDEPTDGFSAQQLDKMRDVLGQLQTEQLILVSHEQKIEGFVDNIIRIRKDNGVTGVE